MTDQLFVTEQEDGLTFVLQRQGCHPEPIAGNDNFETPLTPDDLEDLRWYLEDYLTAPFAVWEDRGEAVQSRLKQFGNRLFNALFGHGETGRDSYLKIEDSPEWELWLSSENPDFLGLPWELLWDPKKPDPLALTLAGINRTLPRREAALDAVSGETLRVLMVISRPSGLNDVNYRAVARPLFEKLEAVAGKVEIELLRPPTFDALKDRLLAAKADGQPYQILHFDGHGTFGTAAGGDLDPAKFKGTAKGYLLFEGATEEQRLVAADDFGTLIDEADVPLVVLNACRSGTLGASVGPEATVATRLMQSGTAAVVAMGFAVYVRAAAEFMATFYECLFQGETVAHAVARGRRQLRRFQLRPSPKGDLPLQDWCVPVHYGRRKVAFPELARVADNSRSGLSLEAALDRLRDTERETAAEQARDALAPIGRFVGRDRAFFMLEQALGRMPVTLLHGVGGTGKTELAKAFARWLQQTGWAQGVFLYSFEPGLASFGLDGLVSQLGLALFGADFIGKTESATQRQELLLDVLNEHRIVLVLDNFETVRTMPDRSGATPPLDHAAAEELRTFLANIDQGADSLVLITSRSDEAWLGDINRLSIGGLDDADVHEFADNLLADRPYAQNRRKSKAFGDLLARLQGHPLSLRLLLPLLEERAAEALIAGLEGQQPLPADEQRDPGRLESLDASVAYSLDQLGNRDRSRLAALSLFEGVVDADLLAILSRMEQVPGRFADISGDDWKALLDRTSDLGLLSGLGLGCYRLHPALPGYLLRAWRTQAGEIFAEEREAAERAFVHATAAFGSWLHEQIATGRAELAMVLIDLQRRSLGRTLGEALARELYGHAQDIVQPLNVHWNARGLVIEADGWVERIRLAIEDEAGKVPDFESDAGALWLFAVGSQANRLLKAGRLDEARSVYAEIAPRLEASDAAHSKRHLATVHHQIGIAAQRRGNLDDAEEWLKKSLAIEEELGNRPGMASSYHQIGIVAQHRGNLDDAEDWYKRSLAILEELGDRPRMASTYHQIGMVAQRRGDLDDAEDWYKRSLAIEEELGNRPGMASSYHQIGMVAQERGHLDDAEDWYKRSLAIKEELGDRPSMARSYHQIGMVAQQRGDLDDAEDWYKKSLVIEEELGNRPGMASSYHQIGTVAQRRGDLDDAEDWYKRSLAIKEELGDRPSMARSYHQIGMVAQQRGELDDAEDWYKKSLVIKKEFGDGPGMALTYGVLGLLEEAKGNNAAALQWAIRCNALFPEFPHPATGGGPGHLARLTAMLGLPALEASWQHCTGKALPNHVRNWVKAEIVKSA